MDVIEHYRRRVLWVGMETDPYTALAARQLLERALEAELEDPEPPVVPFMVGPVEIDPAGGPVGRYGQTPLDDIIDLVSPRR